MNTLIFGNLLHRPLRSIISALAVAIEVIMILSIVAIMLGMLNGSRAQNSGIGMDMLVRPGNAGVLMTGGAASTSVKVADVLAGMPHVRVAAPINAKLSLGTSVENIFGIDYASFNALRPFVFVAGGPFQHPDDVIIDDYQAASGQKFAVGDHIKILGKSFRISGIFEHGKGARKFIPLETMDALDGTPGKASAFYLRTDDAATTAEKRSIQESVRHSIVTTDGMQDYSVQTLDEFLAGLTPDKIPGFKVGLDVVIGIAIIIGFLVIFQSMYTAVMERTREIGILKSMGASSGAIVSLMLRECGLLALAGILVGVAATYLLRAVLHAKYPTMAFSVTPDWVGYGALIAFTGAMLGALYPAFKAARKDPIDALSYE